MSQANDITAEFSSDSTVGPIVVVTIRGGIVQDVHASQPVHVFVEDWDCPPDKPLVIDFASEPVTSEQQARIEASLRTTITSKGE